VGLIWRGRPTASSLGAAAGGRDGGSSAAHEEREAPVIHYMTSNGLGNAWVGNELRVMSSESIPIKLHALHAPPSTFFASEDIARLGREARYLYPLRPLPFARSVVSAPLRFRSRFVEALWNALTGPRESMEVRAKSLLHLLVACHFAETIKDEKVSHIHSQWIHSGGTVAMYGAWLLGVPYSFTGHAADLFRERCALEDKIQRAKFIVCISKFHERFYLENGARPEQLILAYCGIDTSHFSPSDEVGTHDPPHIVSSGRLVEKKGFIQLIDACGVLRDRGVSFRCTIAGSGPQEQELRDRIRSLELQELVTVTGEALLQERIPEFMGQGDVYCLPCVWASDNDVDGLPQMLMEAMACGLPAVSTRLVGIPDLVEHEETGLLAESGDVVGLADCLQRLLGDPELGRRLARAGRERVVEAFDLSRCLDPLVEEYRAALRS
jgi:colanic acid/amylovoran biosynthesis glycosyltransferase